MRAKEEGEALARKRKRKNLTQRKLAALASVWHAKGCSHTTIHLLETGKMRTLSEGLAVAIANALGCELEDIFEERTSSRVPVVATGSVATRQPVMAGRRSA